MRHANSGERVYFFQCPVLLCFLPTHTIVLSLLSPFHLFSSNEFQQLATQIVEVISKLPKTDILVDMIFNLLHKQEKRAKEKDRDESANDNSALNICADIVQAIVNRMVGIKASDPCMAGYIKTLHTFCLARPSLLVSSAEALQAYLHSGM